MQYTTLVLTLAFLIFCTSAISIGSAELEDTMLAVDLGVEGTCTEAGDICLVRVNVTNVGGHTALMTFIQLEEIPENWKVFPPKHLLLSIPQTKSGVVYFQVKRGDDPVDEIHASAIAYNAQKSLSASIPIPIHPGVLIGLVLGLVALVYHGKRPKKKQIK
ncbi:MAG: hypothetical protein KKG04_03305 [Candidatus Thermoplasmatota archaeon]|nr:hypothetical protein [Candidatus Thermoplasmatota archaeon]